MWNTKMTVPQDFHQELMNLFKMRDSEIRNRGDDTTLKTYINRRWPTHRCADPFHTDKYLMRLIITDAKEEENHVVRHHEMLKGILEQSDLIKCLFVYVTTWMRHFLFDVTYKFEMFSPCEV